MLLFERGDPLLMHLKTFSPASASFSPPSAHLWTFPFSPASPPSHHLATLLMLQFSRWRKGAQERVRMGGSRRMCRPTPQSANISFVTVTDNPHRLHQSR